MTFFGELSDGRAVHILKLTRGNLEAEILTYGARLHALRWGGGADLTGATASLAEYEADMRFTGAMVAPVVNRIANARTVLGDTALTFEANQDGVHSLHSGGSGAHALVWQVTDQSPTAVTLAVHLPDGRGGFPGNREVSVRYALTDAGLSLDLQATTDATTLMNPAHHANWELTGTGDWAGQRLEIHADRYLPIDADTLPTGEIAPVDGTEFDLRISRVPGREIDHNYCFAADGSLRHMATLSGAGRSLEVWSDAPGLQVFTGLSTSIALEAQGWPDAPNHPQFPPVVLQPDEVFSRCIEYRIR